MTFKKINAWLHLWLGLASGIIVVIVSLTGCIYVFQKEITSLYEPWRFVKPEASAYMEPSALISNALPYLKKEQPNSVAYKQKDEAAQVSAFDKKKGSFTGVYLNPYTGEVLKVIKNNRKTGEGDFDFFRVILNGHRALWLPYDIGRPIVGVAVLCFVCILISGLIMWWPKKWNKANVDKSFKIKWGASFKRVNYDFHNVFGFYSILILLMISLTGLVWSFDWYSKSVYWATTLGKSLPESRQPSSDSTSRAKFEFASIDKIWTGLKDRKNEGLTLSIPKKPVDPIAATLYLRAGTLYKADNYYFDRTTLKPLKGVGPFAGKYEDAVVGDKLRRMNYDIHTGAIWGIPGKMLVFCASLMCATLPITGFLIWWGKKKKSKKKAKKTIVSSNKNKVMQPSRTQVQQEEQVS